MLKKICFITIFVTVLISCKKLDLNTDGNNTSALIKSLNTYLDLQKKSSTKNKIFIDSLNMLAQWSNVSVKAISEREESVFVPIGIDDTRGMVFVVDTRSMDVETGYMAEILHNGVNVSIPASKVIADFYSYKRNAFTGSIASYDFSNSFKWEMGYKNGANIYKKNIRKSNQPVARNRTGGAVTNGSSCKDWYLVTTYDDGSQDWDFLGTICSDDGCEMNKMLSPQKAGGAVTMSCNGNGGGGGSTGIINTAVVNNIKDPCVKSTVDKIVNSDLKNTITNILQNDFGISGKPTLSFEEQSPGDTRPGHTDAQPDVNYNIITEVTYLNTNFLDNTSQEYAASVVIHEIVHAALTAEGMPAGSGTLQHEAILYKYIDDMSTSLQAFYPSLTLQQSRSICLDGLDNVFGTPLFNQVLARYGFNNDNTSPNYWALDKTRFENLGLGSPCNNGGGGGGGIQ